MVIKPDVGLRGRGVTVVRTRQALEASLAGPREDSLVQEHVAGDEFGVFYARLPGAPSGAILSINAKSFPAVVGDGRRTLEELILGDDRAVCQARLHLARHRAELPRVPAQVALHDLDRLHLKAGQHRRELLIGKRRIHLAYGCRELRPLLACRLLTGGRPDPGSPARLVGAGHAIFPGRSRR